jgi:hypothetical protein
MELRETLHLLGQVLAHLGELVAVHASELDVRAALAHPHSALPGREMFGQK